MILLQIQQEIAPKNPLEFILHKTRLKNELEEKSK
jgi:hypothetical protein